MEQFKVYDGLPFDSHFAIAVSFDGTLTKDYDDLTPNFKAIEVVKELWNKGCVIVLWTCRQSKRLMEAIDFCEQHNIPIDYVNTYPYRGGVKKINVDCFIDSLNIGGVDWDKVLDQIDTLISKDSYDLIKR